MNRRPDHHRRALIKATLAGAACGLAPFARAADRFPSQAIHLVVPYPAGGATDIVARSLADKLAIAWQQPVVVDNRAGAGTTLAALQVARSPANGYTLFMTTSAHTISASIYKKLAYDPVADFTALTLIVKVPLVLVVPPSLPANNLAEFIQLARTRPKGLTFASPGVGTAQHLAGEMFRHRVQVPFTHIPYRGDAPAVNDLMGGQVDCMFATLTTVLGQVASGRLRAIAIANDTRVAQVANIPTFTESGLPHFEAATWFGVLAPKGLPDELRQTIVAEIRKIVAEPDMQKRLLELGGQVMNTGPAEFETFMQVETKKWRDVVVASGVTVD